MSNTPGLLAIFSWSPGDGGVKDLRKAACDLVDRISTLFQTHLTYFAIKSAAANQIRGYIIVLLEVFRGSGLLKYP